jgi:DedD protein
MRPAELYEEEESTTGSGELNLGLGSLIGIFFGLALVCGVFFGFGYMLGHRKPSVDVTPETASPASRAQTTAPKPSAQVLQQPSEAARVVVPASSTDSKEEAASGESTAPVPVKAAALTPAPRPGPPAAASAPTRSSPAPPTAVALAPNPAAIASSGTIMVQIAAVKNRPDAEALAAALRKNGFNAAIRTESQDKLWHVQVGPFENRDDAKAMRQKLANAGYNAFIK